jgi:hypothetical protein
VHAWRIDGLREVSRVCPDLPLTWACQSNNNLFFCQYLLMGTPRAPHTCLFPTSSGGPTNCTPAQGYRFRPEMSDYSDDAYSEAEDGSTHAPSQHEAPQAATAAALDPLVEGGAAAAAAAAAASSEEVLIARLRRLVTMKQTRLKVCGTPYHWQSWWAFGGGAGGNDGWLGWPAGQPPLVACAPGKESGAWL